MTDGPPMRTRRSGGVRPPGFAGRTRAAGPESAPPPPPASPSPASTDGGADPPTVVVLRDAATRSLFVRLPEPLHHAVEATLRELRGERGPTTKQDLVIALILCHARPADRVAIERLHDLLDALEHARTARASRLKPR
jgi:hypothetical protein